MAFEPVIPDFELVKLIKSGSYGDVWLGRSVTGQWRAIKVIARNRFASEKPFEREFTGIQQVERRSKPHPNLAQVFHVGRSESAQFFYYVLELADDEKSGPTVDSSSYSPRTLLTDLASEEVAPFTRCLEVAKGVALGLSHLHESKLVHRDVKPSNIIFVSGIPKLADFGLVTPAEHTASFVGTPGYIAPEGPGRQQSDIYSFGRVLFDLVWGVGDGSFPELPSNFQSLPDWKDRLRLNEVVARACDPDPRRRYLTAREVLRDLESVSVGKALEPRLPHEESFWRSILRFDRQRLPSFLFPIALVIAGLLSTASYFREGFLQPVLLLAFWQVTLLLFFGFFNRRLSEDARFDFSRWLQGKNGRTRPFGWLPPLAEVFDRACGRKHFSRRCMVRSLGITALAIFLLTGTFFLLNPERIRYGTAYIKFPIMLLVLLVGGTALTLLPSYLGLFATRRALCALSRTERSTSAAFLGITTVLTTVVGVALWLTIVSFGWANTIFSHLGVNGAWLRQKIHLYDIGVYTYIDGIRSFIWENLALHDVFGIFIYAAILTFIFPAWFILSSVLARTTLKLSSISRVAQRRFNIETAPVIFVEFVSVLVLTLGFVGTNRLYASASVPTKNTAKSITSIVCPITRIRLIEIPAGRFLMGDQESSASRSTSGHWVELSGFYLGETEVTQDEWATLMERNPSFFSKVNNPVDAVTWNLVDEFIRKLNERMRARQASLVANHVRADVLFANYEYRLPTEAEWEYACRAGSTGRFSCPDNHLNEFAWTVHNSGGRTHAVRTRLPNAWGLYDMHGNLREWCLDWFGADYYQNSPLRDPRGPATGERKILRGGSWLSDGRICDAKVRHANRPAEEASRAEFGTVGFRLAFAPRRASP